jgi:hypothetical protein
MLALSIRQPFLWAILFGGKRIENRSGWAGCALRGDILLHAGKTCTAKEHAEAVDFMFPIGVSPAPWIPPRQRGAWPEGAKLSDRLAFGALLGIARIDGAIHDDKDFAAYAANVPGGEAQRAWWIGGFALVLADVRVFERPIACSAQLNFFDVPWAMYGGKPVSPAPVRKPFAKEVHT